MPRRRFLAGLLPLVLLACRAAPRPPADAVWMLGEPAPRDAPTARVLAVVREAYTDLSERAWDRFRTRFWPAASVARLAGPPEAPDEGPLVSGVDLYVAGLRRELASTPIFQEWASSVELRVAGRMAQVWARHEMRRGRPGLLRDSSGIDAFVLLQEGGRWGIVSLTTAPESALDGA